MLPTFITESELWGPVTAASVFALLLVISGIVNVVLRLIIRRWTNRSPNALGLGLIITFRGPIVLFIALAGLFTGLLVLTELSGPRYAIVSAWAEWFRKAWLVIIIAELTFLTYHLLDVLISWYINNIAARTQSQMDDRLLPPLRRILPLATYSVGTLFALSALGIPISPIWAALGIGGIAVALAVQPTLANFFAGTYVVTEGELNIGNYIELENGPAGYVVEVGWRSTKVRTMFGNLVIIPNSRMAESIVTNYNSPTPDMSIIVYCGVSYDSDLDHVQEVVMAACDKLVAESPHAIHSVAPWFGFERFDDSNIAFWVFIQAADRLASFALTSDLVKTIHRSLREAGVEINYPMRKLVSANGGPVTIVPPNLPTSGA
jgi:small-conductance mechanosensitive channel